MLRHQFLLLPLLALLGSCVEPCPTYSPDAHLQRGCSGNYSLTVLLEGDSCWVSADATVTTDGGLLIRAAGAESPADTILISLPSVTSTAGSWVLPEGTADCAECGEVEMRFADGRPTLRSRYGWRPGWVVLSWNRDGTVEGMFECTLADINRREYTSLTSGVFKIVEGQ